MAAYVRDSDTKLENINYKAAAIYIASTCSRSEFLLAGLSQAVPRRRFKRGPTPGLSNVEVTRRIPTIGAQQKMEDLERGGGQGGRGNPPLPSSSPTALPPNHTSSICVDASKGRLH